MKYLIIIVVNLAAFLLTGCNSSKKMLTSAPVIVQNTDSVRTEYIETVRIDTIPVEVLVPMESVKQVVQDSTSHLETSLAESNAWINANGTLGHSIKNKEQKLKADVLVSVKDTKTNNAETKVKEIPVPYPKPVYIERDFTKWELFRLNAFWYLVIIVFVSLGWVLRKPLITIIRKCL